MDTPLTPMSNGHSASHTRVKLETDVPEFSGNEPGEIPGSRSCHHLHPTTSEVKIKQEAMRCLHCPYTDESIELLKLHMFSFHPTNAAVVSNNFVEASFDHPDVTFFCVKETCSFASSVCNLYEEHLMSCCPFHKILSGDEEERLKSSVIFIIEFHSKYCLPPSNGFPQFISSFIKACTEKDGSSSKTLPFCGGEKAMADQGGSDADLVSGNIDIAVKDKDHKISLLSCVHSEPNTFSQHGANRLKSEMHIQEHCTIQNSDDASQEYFEHNKDRQMDKAAMDAKQDDAYPRNLYMNEIRLELKATKEKKPKRRRKKTKVMKNKRSQRDHDQFLMRDALRKKAERRKWTDEQKQKHRERCRINQKKYRARKLAAKMTAPNASITTPVCSKRHKVQTQEEKRKKHREYMRKCRANWSAQKRTEFNMQRMQRYYQLKKIKQ